MTIEEITGQKPEKKTSPFKKFIGSVFGALLVTSIVEILYLIVAPEAPRWSVYLLGFTVYNTIFGFLQIEDKIDQILKKGN